MSFIAKAKNTIVARGANEEETERIMKLVRKCVLAAEQSPSVHNGKVATHIAKFVKDSEDIDEMEKNLDELYWFILGWEDANGE